MKLTALTHCVFNLNIHLILVTKYRVFCLDAAMLTKLSELFTTLAKTWHCELLEFNGEKDHATGILHIHLMAARSGQLKPTHND